MNLINRTIEQFRNILSIQDIELIYINHLIQFPIPLLMNLIQDSGVGYIFPTLTGSKTLTKKFSKSKEVRWGINCP